MFRCYVISLFDDYNRVLHIKQIHMIEANKYQLVDDDESATNFRSLQDVLCSFFFGTNIIKIIDFLVNERKYPLRENITSALGNLSAPSLKPKFESSQANFDVEHPPIAMPVQTSLTQMLLNIPVFRGN